jgi:hypothetical protein
MLGGMPKSQEKVITNIKCVGPKKAMKKKGKPKQAAKEKMKYIKSRTADSDPQSLKP